MGKFLTNKNYKKKYFQKNLFRNKKFFPSNFSRRIRLNRWLLYRFNKQKRYSFLKLFKLAKINTRILKHIFLKKVLKNEVRLKSFLFFNRKKFVRLIKCSGLYKVSKKYNYTRKKLYFLRFNFKGINKKSLRKKIKKKKLLRDLKPKFLWPSESLNSDKFILQTNKKNSKSYLLLRREKFYKWKSYFQFRLNLKKNQNRKRYYLFFKKSTNNTFLTVTDSKGNVIISKSAGSCKIKTKKKKKSRDTLQDISRVLIKAVLLKNIKYIYTMFMWNGWVKNARIIGREFVIKKIKILGIKNLILKPHSKPMKKKKPKRR